MNRRQLWIWYFRNGVPGAVKRVSTTRPPAKVILDEAERLEGVGAVGDVLTILVQDPHLARIIEHRWKIVLEPSVRLVASETYDALPDAESWDDEGGAA